MYSTTLNASVSFDTHRLLHLPALAPAALHRCPALHHPHVCRLHTAGLHCLRADDLQLAVLNAPRVIHCAPQPSYHSPPLRRTRPPSTPPSHSTAPFHLPPPSPCMTTPPCCCSHTPGCSTSTPPQTPPVSQPAGRCCSGVEGAWACKLHARFPAKLRGPYGEGRGMTVKTLACIRVDGVMRHCLARLL